MLYTRLDIIMLNMSTRTYHPILLKRQCSQN